MTDRSGETPWWPAMTAVVLLVVASVAAAVVFGAGSSASGTSDRLPYPECAAVEAEWRERVRAFHPLTVGEELTCIDQFGVAKVISYNGCEFREAELPDAFFDLGACL